MWQRERQKDSKHERDFEALLMALGFGDPCTRARERPLASEGGPQLTASKETSVLQLQGSELYQQLQ